MGGKQGTWWEDGVGHIQMMPAKGQSKPMQMLSTQGSLEQNTDEAKISRNDA